ncbi:MAG: tetratricopeptide repeat protein [Candidatus Omnitrophica bacterium]|nr:tetratricopeptide repeat protein [Candidatus Omnitrophota bacterium]
MKNIKTVLIILLCLMFINTSGLCREPGSEEPTVSQKEAEILEQVIKLSEEDLETAIEFLSAKVVSNSSSALDFSLGNLYFQKDKLEEAEDAYRNALKKLPGFSRARANLARILIGQGKIDAAIKEFKEILLAGKTRPSTLTLIGYTFLLKDRPVPAETAYRQALLLEPDDINAYLGLAKCLVQQERFKEAVKVLEDLLEDNPLNKELWFLLANANLALEKSDRAVITLECARRLDLASDQALASLGDLYLNQGQADEALIVYKEAFSMEEPSIDRLLRAVEGFIMMRQPSQAAVLLKRGHILEQAGKVSWTPAQSCKLCWLKARQAHLKGEHEFALKAYNSLLEKDPLHGPALLATGDLHREEGRLEQALIFYERAGRIQDKEVKALIRQAQVEVDRQGYGRAVELLEAAQVLKPRAYVTRYLEQVRRLVR